jgi:sec-independent protein translocase protein TatC
LEPKVNEYLSLMMQLIFAFGLCFQLPVVMTLLARVGLATSKGMAAKRKYAIVGVFIVAAIFTPPDPLSQLSLAIPIIILYEISIIMAKMVEKKRAEREGADDLDLGDDDLEADGDGDGDENVPPAP